MAERRVAPEIELLCGGRVHAGWKAARVSLSMEHCANSFDLETTELWPGRTQPFVVMPGNACELRVAGEVVISGYVDDVDLSIDDKQHGVALRGRDRAADLIDCSAVVKGGQWTGQRVEAIAAQLAKPFGVRVGVAVDSGKPLATFALQHGETAFEAIDRAARMRALLVVSDARGGIVITRAGTQVIATSLVLGENVLQARMKLSQRERFSRYIALGQTGSALALSHDAAALKQATHVRAEAVDAEVLRYRPLIITAEAQDVAASLAQRVQWEANVRAARSNELSVTVAGWTHAAGLWAPNRLVHAELPALRVSGQLLIKACQFSLDSSGATTELTLTRRDAFTILPLKVATGVPLKLDEPKK